ncbi:YdeI/OmpD-associated family protein [Actinomycetospora chlora]|uniref:YdeI/OmpD-associated family protein n=1 Tax=Actinomycetospora chlora TaxID=663608 RepID=A0ABP9AMZ0_9PSEU
MLSAVVSDEQVQPDDVDAWRAWLAEHHDRGHGVWLVTWKPRTGRPTVGYEESVEQALCFGWIDSTTRSLDDERTAMWFGPRRRGSGWARSNKQRIARLEEAGLVAPAGRALIDAAKADGSWTMLDDVEDLVVPPDLAAAFDAHPGAREQWDGFSRSARRAMLVWLVEAKRPATRAGRITKIADAAAVGEKAFPPQ